MVDVQVRDSSIIDVGEADDFVSIGGSLKSSAKIFLGDGEDSLIIGDAIQDTVTIDAGAGNDEVDLSTASIAGSLALTLGGGDDSLRVRTLDDLGHIAGELDAGDLVELKTGTGDDITTRLAIDDSGNLLIDGVAKGITVAASGTLYSLKVKNGATGETATITHPVPPPPTLPSDTVNVNGQTVDVITGTDGDDDIDIRGIDSVIIVSLSGGDNTVTAGGNGGDSIFTGDGNNQITVTGGTGNYISLGNGDNTLQVGGDSATIQSGSGDDQATVVGDNAKVDLGGGDNTLNLSGNKASVTAGSGDDQATIAGDNANVDLGDGSDAATVAANDAQIDLGDGSDSLALSGLGGTVAAGIGDDVIFVTGGTGHSLDAGSGSDSISVRGTYETIYAGTGDDTIIFDGTGTDGFNYVELTEDNNLVSMQGGDGHTTINGGVSADSLYFTGGDVEGDVLNLGGGNDFVHFDSQAGQSFGSNIARANNTTLRAGIGDDSVYAWSAEQAMMDGGTGDDSINIVNARYTTIVSGSGDDSIVLGTDGNGNDATDNSTGYNVVNLRGDGDGTGHNVVTIGGGLTNNTIYGGTEKDVIDLGQSGGRNAVTLSAKQSTITAGQRDDTITAASGNMTLDAGSVERGQNVYLEGYTADRGHVLTGTGIATVTTAGADYGKLSFAVEDFVGETAVFSADGRVKTAQGGYIDGGVEPAANDSGALVYLGSAGETQAVWYATAFGSNGNQANQLDPMIMTGANNEAADTMLGGKGNDTLYVGTGDLAAGGKGDDTIINTGSLDTREQFGLAKGNGKDSVQNFGGGFDNTSDAVTFYESSLLNGTTASYDGKGNLVLTNGDASLTLQMAAGTDSVSAHVVLKNGLTGEDERLSVLNKNATEEITDATVTKYYYGSKDGGSALDASALSTGVKVDLGNSGRYFAAGENYSYITAVKGSDHGDNFLAGSGTTAETLTGGNGVNNTLYGGGSSNDVLLGGGTSGANGNGSGIPDIAAQDTFYFGSTDGKDVIQNIGNGDKVMFYDLKDDGSVTAETVTMNGGAYLRLTNTTTGAQLFLESAGSETYEVLFTEGVNGAMTARYEVTGTEFRKVV